MSDSLFCLHDLGASLEAYRKRLRDHVEGLAEDYILKVNEVEMIKHLVREFWVTPLEIAAEAHLVGDREISEQVQGAFEVYTKHTQVVDVALAFTGDSGLFNLKPSTWSSGFPRGKVEQREVRRAFILDPNRSPETVKQEIEYWVNSIREFVNRQQPQIEAWNQQVEHLATTIFAARKARHLKKNDMVASIGLPMRARHDPLGTYSIPVNRKNLSPKPAPPTAPSGEYLPHPAMDEANYREILGHLRHMSRTVERDPFAFTNLGEESLRAHFLMHLNGAYDGQATGETFSFKGKTDIFVSVKERAVFIAECKFWTGAAAFGSTINQLLGYLTWRESKTAILLFVRNTDIGNVLEQIPALVSEHPHYTKREAWSEKGEFRFIFRSPRDESLPLILTIMCFHFPKLKEPGGE